MVGLMIGLALLPPLARAQTGSGPPLRLAPGWKLILDEEGQPFAERRARKINPVLWKVGLTLFMVPLGSVLASGFDPHDENGWVYGGLAVLPIGGPLYLAAFEGGTHHDAARAAGWAVAGLVQSTGLAMLLVGAVGTGAIKIERAPLRFSVGPTVGGFEAGLRGAF